jgi:hypothetical protein
LSPLTPEQVAAAHKESYCTRELWLSQSIALNLLLNRIWVSKSLIFNPLLDQAWFRELPTGVLDTLTPEQVAAAQKESEVVALVKQLPDIHRALLDWAVDLMADVVEQQSYNKMNARNIAMVFAPNMTQVRVNHRASWFSAWLSSVPDECCSG